MRDIAGKAHSMRSHNESLKTGQMSLMLRVYQLQRQKEHLARVSAKLKYVNVLRQSLPVI